MYNNNNKAYNLFDNTILYNNRRSLGFDSYINNMNNNLILNNNNNNGYKTQHKGFFNYKSNIYIGKLKKNTSHSNFYYHS